ncbi:MAG: RidA family protein [Mycobacterium leprae]
MSKQPIHPAGAPIGGPYTPGIAAGGFVFVSGQTPRRPGTGEVVSEDVTAQTHQVLANVESVLAAAGCTMADVLKVNAYLTDMNDFAAFNAAYETHFPAPYPARTTLQVGLRGIRVEVDVIALKPEGR